jgi:molybdenum cofactor cytidylyltransferase
MMVGLLMAGGASTRMGRAKALVPCGPESFVAHGVRILWGTCDTVVVVLGADAARIRKRIEEEFVALVQGGRFDCVLHAARGQRTRQLEVRFVVNRQWKKGMYSSVRLGLATALRLRPEAVMILPVDHPHVRATTVFDLGTVMGQAVQAARRPRTRAGFSYALVPRFRGRRGHPIALSAALARAIAKDGTAVHLADAVRRSARLVGYLDVRDAGVTRNVNRPGD